MANEGQTAVVTAVRRSQPIELGKNFLKLWSGISSLADDPLLQDNVRIQRGLFHHIYHIGCAFNLRSIINNGLIPGGQNLNNRQTVFLLPVDPMDKNHRDPDTIDLNAPLHAQYMHEAWKKHQNTAYWVHAQNRRRRTRKGPEPACVQTPFHC